MTAPTLSRLGHLAACPGSACFPRQEEERGPEARLGSAIHEFVERRVEANGLRDGSDFDVARAAYVHGARSRETFEPLMFTDASEAAAEVDRQQAWRPAEGSRRLRAWIVGA